MTVKREVVLSSQLGIGLAMCGAAVLLVSSGIYGWFEDKSFKARALKTAGDVIALDPSRRVFRFETNRGVIVDIPIRPRSVFNRDPVGAHIQVFYDPIKPSRVVRDRWFNLKEDAGLGMICAAPFLLLTGLLIVWADRRHVRKKWEVIDALAARGVVVPRPALHVFFFE